MSLFSIEHFSKGVKSQENYFFIMNTQLVASLGILVLLIGITSATGVHYAAARGMPTHNPNWASVVADPTSQNGHAPACCSGNGKIIVPTKAVDPKDVVPVTKITNSIQVQKNKDMPIAQDNVKTKPQQQKINRENQSQSESAKISSDKAKSNALIKANTHNSDIKLNQKPKK